LQASRPLKTTVFAQKQLHQLSKQGVAKLQNNQLQEACRMLLCVHLVEGKQQHNTESHMHTIQLFGHV
jgi:hypothetical protein